VCATQVEGEEEPEDARQGEPNRSDPFHAGEIGEEQGPDGIDRIFQHEEGTEDPEQIRIHAHG
jgi:hypothetical protein